MIVYESDGLRAESVDNCAIALYVEGAFLCEMTREEWRNINLALEGLKDED